MVLNKNGLLWTQLRKGVKIIKKVNFFFESGVFLITSLFMLKRSFLITIIPKFNYIDY